MAGELLDRPRRCAAHRQVRTERVARDVNPRFVPDPGPEFNSLSPLRFSPARFAWQLTTRE